MVLNRINFLHPINSVELKFNSVIFCFDRHPRFKMKKLRTQNFLTLLFQLLIRIFYFCCKDHKIRISRYLIIYFRRMQVGVSNNLTNNTRSVGQRIKDASLKDVTFTVPTAFSVNEQTTSASPNHPSHTIKASRTTCLSCDKGHRFHQASPIMLSEVQRSTVRIIGQYLRDLGMRLVICY